MAHFSDKVVLSVHGGRGSDGLAGGGGGGGGRVLIQTGNGGFSIAGTIDVSGGSGGFGDAISGVSGSAGFVQVVPSMIPTPTSLVLLGTGLLGALGAGWLRCGRARAADGC